MTRNKKLTILGVLVTVLVMTGALSIPAWANVKTGVAAYKSGNYARAYNEFAPLANQGNKRAQYNLGILFLTGRGVPKDARTAVD